MIHNTTTSYNTHTQFTEEYKMATALTPQTDVTPGVTWLMENPRQKIKSIKNPIKHFLFFYFTKSETSDSFVNYFDGHFAYLKTLDFYFNAIRTCITIIVIYCGSDDLLSSCTVNSTLKSSYLATFFFLFFFFFFPSVFYSNFCCNVQQYCDSEYNKLNSHKQK